MSDGQPAYRLLEDAGRLIGASVSEFVPPDAQLHLFNAQRELLLAFAAVIEHNAQRSIRNPRAPRAGAKRAARRPSRVTLD